MLDEFSRRAVLSRTSAFVASALWLPFAYAQSFTKSPQSSAGYQNTSNGNQRCGGCIHFQPPTSCKVVAGQISPNGWCRIFAAKKT